MTKSVKHKRIRKENLQKIKLKVGKKLKKPQNETKTDFKAKKIIMKDQLPDKILISTSTKRFTIQELLYKLSHHSNPVRDDGFKGMIELVTKIEKMDLFPVLSDILKAVNPFILDADHSFRISAIKIIEVIIKKVGNMLEPYFHHIASHLSCAMIHLDSGVQKDSLQLMDVLLSHASTLLAVNADLILKNFFMLISRKMDPSNSSNVEKNYSLISNPSSMLASMHWRTKLFRNLSRYLAVILGEKNKTESSVPLSIWQVITIGSMPSLVKRGNTQCSLQEARILTEEEEVKTFARDLFPLMFETWEEASHNLSCGSLGISLNAPSIKLLHYILDITLSIWKIVEIVTHMDATKCKWFMTYFEKHFKEEIIEGFPYSPLEDSIASKRKHKENSVNNAVSDCLSLNITLASLIFLFKKNDLNLKKKISNYYIDSLVNIEEIPPQKLPVVVTIVSSLLKNDSGVNYNLRENLLGAGLQGYQSLSGTSKYRLLKLPLQASDLSSKFLWKSESLRDWIIQIINDTLENPEEEALLNLTLQFKLRKTPNFSTLFAEKKELLIGRLEETSTPNRNNSSSV